MKTQSPSATALIVALGQLCVRHRLPHLVSRRSEALLRTFLAAAPAPYRVLARLTRFPTTAAWLEASMNRFLPGLFAHQAARKFAIEREVRAALDAGCAQVVVLGAGLDTLGRRLARETPVWEVDHPATQALKRAVLARTNERVEHHRPQLVAHDLTQDTLGTALRGAPGFDARRPTVFVLEGVAMYLTPAQVENLLGELRALAAPHSRLLLTVMEKREGRRPGFFPQSPLVDLWLHFQREPFHWAAAPDELGDFMTTCGWNLTETLGPAKLRKLSGLCEKERLSEGEIVCQCVLSHEGRGLTGN